MFFLKHNTGVISALPKVLWCCLWGKVQAPQRALDADCVFWRFLSHTSSLQSKYDCVPSRLSILPHAAPSCHGHFNIGIQPPFSLKKANKEESLFLLSSPSPPRFFLLSFYKRFPLCHYNSDLTILWLLFWIFSNSSPFPYLSSPSISMTIPSWSLLAIILLLP